MLTQKRLGELVNYDQKTGIFTRKTRTANRVHVGDTVGSLNNNGYLTAKIDKKTYQVHRLAWLFVNGYFPEHEVDHINRIRIDNRISNLREVSKQCNMRNRKNNHNNTSGVKGVVWNKNAKKWRAQIKINNLYKHLGFYNSFDNAVCARLAGEQACKWSGCEANSPALQYVKEIIND